MDECRWRKHTPENFRYSFINMLSIENVRLFLGEVSKVHQTGRATEHSYRPFLKELFESASANIDVINEPKRVSCGAPDLIVVRKGQDAPIGYVEAKDLHESLAKAENSSQLKRYREALPNLILTNCLEFRWYVRGDLRQAVHIASLTGNRLEVEEDGVRKAVELLHQFADHRPSVVKSPKELAVRMAAAARLIREGIRLALETEKKEGKKTDSLHGQMQGMRDVLLHDLTEDTFADMYAQTLCYGLFAARCNFKNQSGNFTRRDAAEQLPKTNPFLRKLFRHIAGADLHEAILWIVDDLAELLNITDVDEVLKGFGTPSHSEDPVIHFYEDFLAAYDPVLRKASGVYYTPKPVVSYIIKSVDQLLKNDFGIPDGLADSEKICIKNDSTGAMEEVHRVLVLDPAVGTGTFLHAIIEQIAQRFAHSKGMWSGYVSEHLLPRLFDFEIMMAAYSIAHLKLGLQLGEAGYDFSSDERLQVYLTNALGNIQGNNQSLPFVQWLSDEATAANNIKADKPVMVIVGNPPYSSKSKNNGDWITSLMDGFDHRTKTKTASYFYTGEEPKNKGSMRPLHDDYVKFIRAAHRRIEQTGYGILAFITNHGYIDNKSFQAMRKSLLDTFDDIYILNLHGGIKELAPDGIKDDNIFDISVGVSIALFVKRQDACGGSKVHYAELWGARRKKEGTVRDGKLDWLVKNDVTTTDWSPVAPSHPFYFFKPQNESLSKEYLSYWKLDDVTQFSSKGIVTYRDHLVTGFTEGEVLQRLMQFADASLTDKDAERQLKVRPARDWHIPESRKMVRDLLAQKVRPERMLYRVFDYRFCFNQRAVVGCPRLELARHLNGKQNYGLLVSGQKVRQYNHVFASRGMFDFHALEGIASCFPIYINRTDSTFYDDTLELNLKDSFIN